MFKPTLAATLPILAGSNPPAFDFSGVSFPVMVSPKLDGIRATIQNGIVLSRSLKSIPNSQVQELFGKPELDGVDGELIVGSPVAKDCFQASCSGVMTRKWKPTMDVTFYVFDVHVPGGFAARFKTLEALVGAVGNERIKVVPHVVVNSPAELTQVEELFLAQGFEGLMIRSVNGPYKEGRSTLNEGYLLKVKRFVDSEAIVLGFTAQMHNGNVSTTNELGRSARSSHQENKTAVDTLGKMQVRDIHDGREFSIAAFGTLKVAKEIWDNQTKYLGKILKYKHQAIGAVDKPRLPIALGWRHAGDMS